VAYGHREVLIKAFVDEVVISCGAEVIARHRRSYEREDLIFDPLHYLALIEHKIGALDQAAPLVGWDLPQGFTTLRRLLEARMGKAGKREYVQVLRLLETFQLDEVESAVGEARDDKQLLRLQKKLAGLKLLIIDELGFVPLSKTGAELLFEVFSQRYERGSTLVTSNLPFDEWTEVFGSERLTGALLDRLTHHVHILEMNGDSYRLNQSRRHQRDA
jgi:hypothetical protein